MAMVGFSNTAIQGRRLLTIFYFSLLAATWVLVRVRPSSARLQVKGAGTTVSTNAIFAENSASAGLFAIRDNGEAFILGSVGIGTSSPNAVADLHVADTSDARIWLDATSADTMELYSGTGVGMFNRSNSYLMLGTNNTERLRIDASGNVGIGTSSPVNYGSGSQGLTINGTGNYQNLNLQVGGTTQFTIYTNGVSGTFINQVTADPMMFYTSDTERMRITSGGALEIGPAANKVIIKSQGSFQNTTLESHIINADGTGAYGSGDVLIQPRCSSVSSNNIVFGTSGGTNTTTERMRIDASGNFFVGATALTADANFFGTSPGNAFSDFGHITGVASGVSYTRFLYAGSVIGSITQSGTIAVLYNTSSDQRLKENIADADDAGSKIDAIKYASLTGKLTALIKTTA
jgi:hypothetical protein